MAAVLALVAAVFSATALRDASAEVLVAEVWRTVGLTTWAALFALLAVRPGLLAVWVIALSSKLALVIVGLLVGFAVPGASDLVLWDGALSLVLAAGVTAAARMRALERAAEWRSAPQGFTRCRSISAPRGGTTATTQLWGRLRMRRRRRRAGPEPGG